MRRYPGFYWVKVTGGEVTIARYSGRRWRFTFTFEHPRRVIRVLSGRLRLFDAEPRVKR